MSKRMRVEPWIPTATRVCSFFSLPPGTWIFRIFNLNYQLIILNHPGHPAPRTAARCARARAQHHAQCYRIVHRCTVHQCCALCFLHMRMCAMLMHSSFGAYLLIYSLLGSWPGRLNIWLMFKVTWHPCLFSASDNGCRVIDMSDAWDKQYMEEHPSMYKVLKSFASLEEAEEFAKSLPVEGGEIHAGYYMLL